MTSELFIVLVGAVAMVTGSALEGGWPLFIAGVLLMGFAGIGWLVP